MTNSRGPEDARKVLKGFQYSVEFDPKWSASELARGNPQETVLRKIREHFGVLSAEEVWTEITVQRIR